jgi:hypothetical protein
MLRDKAGNRLYRRVEIKIFFPDKIFPVKKMHQYAEPHKGFSPEGIDDLLMQTTDKLDQLYPWWEFKCVELTPEGRTARYNFVMVGYRTDFVALKEKLDAVPTPPEVKSEA